MYGSTLILVKWLYLIGTFGRKGLVAACFMWRLSEMFAAVLCFLYLNGLERSFFILRHKGITNQPII